MYKSEKLIYNNVVDVSKETSIANNKLFVRIVLRNKIKPKNWFRRQEVSCYYFDIEYESPLLNSYDDSVCLWHSRNVEQKEYNKKIGEQHNIIVRIINEEIWKCKNFIFDFNKNGEYENTVTRVFKNGQIVR